MTAASGRRLPPDERRAFDDSHRQLRVTATTPALRGPQIRVKIVESRSAR
jgi:hypothetical protein